MTDLMLIVPHPDDEVFSAGGLLSKMAEAGKHSTLVSLTRGGAGRTLELCTRAELPKVREQEWLAALNVLGVNEKHLFDFPDGNLKNLPQKKVLPNIIHLLETLKPEVIVTFPPNGSNGHPDHVATHKFVIKALEKSQYNPKRLYYYATETPFAGDIRADFMNPNEVKSLHLPPTHYLDMNAYVENKLRAMSQYETQALSVLMFMRRLTRKLLYESFHRAKPVYPEQGPITVGWL